MRPNPQADKFEVNSKLMHRVLAPRGFSSPFSFGGGGSGLTDGADNALSQIFSWDYMGAAEYEFGAAGRCLQFMRDNIADFIAVTFPFDSANWHALVHKNHAEQARILWHNVLTGIQKLKESANTNNLKVRGWFDFENGWFVSRDAEMRDNLKHLLEAHPCPESPSATK